MFLFSAIYTVHWLPYAQFVMTPNSVSVLDYSLWSVCVVFVSVLLIHSETDVEAQRLGLWRVGGTLTQTIALLAEGGCPCWLGHPAPHFSFSSFSRRHLSLSSLSLLLITLSLSLIYFALSFSPTLHLLESTWFSGGVHSYRHYTSRACLP